jgi:hypothetical protein
MALSEQPGFDHLTPAQREEVQDWYARRYLAMRELGSRRLKRVKPYQLPARPWPRRSLVLETPPTLRRLRYDAPSYQASIRRPGSGGYGNQNRRGKSSAASAVTPTHNTGVSSPCLD